MVLHVHLRLYCIHSYIPPTDNANCDILKYMCSVCTQWAGYSLGRAFQQSEIGFMPVLCEDWWVIQGKNSQLSVVLPIKA